MNTTAERVKALIANAADCGVEQVADDKNLADLGMDSLDRFEMVMFLEDAFSIEIPDKEYTPVNTVAEVVALVERLVGAKV